MSHHDTEERRAYQREWRAKNIDAAREYQREWRRRARAAARPAAIAALGGVCTGCGHDDERVLQFDHVNGGGTKERRHKDQIALFQEIAKGIRTDFQLLCANCHVLKTMGLLGKRIPVAA